MTQPSHLPRPTDLETVFVLDRFRSRTDEYGLRPDEIDELLWLPFGTAALMSASHPPTTQTESRIRHFIEVVDVAGSLLGDAGLVGAWLRMPVLGLNGLSPLRLFIREPQGLVATRNQLRREAYEATLQDVRSA
jgi:hypothetical protein